MFLQRSPKTPTLRFAVKEVAAVRWTDVSFFNNVAHLPFERVSIPAFAWLPRPVFGYPAIRLPPTTQSRRADSNIPDSTSLSGTVVVENPNAPPTFLLWGLTLYMTAALLTRLGHGELTRYLARPEHDLGRKTFVQLIAWRLAWQSRHAVSPGPARPKL